MWKKLGVSALVAGAGAVAYALTRPDTFRVERSRLIAARPDAVFPLLNDFQRWIAWSPYERMDTHMERSFSGPASGPGATYAWKGRRTGEGRMTILESVPGQRLVIRLEFVKPMAANDRIVFELMPTGNDTRVRWSMEGTNTLRGKLLAPFMEQFVGKQFAEGLANLDLAAREVAQRPSMEGTSRLDQPGVEPAPFH